MCDLIGMTEVKEKQQLKASIIDFSVQSKHIDGIQWPLKFNDILFTQNLLKLMHFQHHLLFPMLPS